MHIRARCLYAAGNAGDALILLAEAEPLIVDISDPILLRENLQFRHRILAGRGDDAEAAPLRVRLTQLCGDLGIPDASPYLQTGEPEPHQVLARLRAEERKWRESGNRRMLAFTLAEAGHLLARVCDFPLAALPFLTEASRLGPKYCDDFFRDEVATLLRATQASQAERAQAAVPGALSKRIVPAFKALFFGGLGLLALVFALRAGGDSLIGWIAFLIYFGLTLPLWAAARRNLQAVLSRETLYLTPQGILWHQWRGGGNFGLVDLIGSLFRFSRRQEAHVVLWSGLRQVWVGHDDGTWNPFAPRLMFGTSEGDMACTPDFAGGAFGIGPKRVKDVILDFASENGLPNPQDDSPVRTSKLAMATVFLALFPGCLIPGVALVALPLCWISKRRIDHSSGKLVGLSFIRMAALASTVQLLIYAFVVFRNM
jgi:hypothetical protein